MMLLSETAPMGLVAWVAATLGSTARGGAGASGRAVTGALLIGVDPGPNLSVTGSLATILWLQAIRRMREDVTSPAFLKVGAVAMSLALAAAPGTRLLIG